MIRFKNLKISHMIMISIGIVFVLGATLNIILVLYSMRQQSLWEAEAKARILLDRNMATHTYFSEIMKPKLLEWTAPFRTKEYFEPSWMSSTYAVREIHKYFSSFNPEKYYIKDAAINARSPENEADDFERAFLEKLKKDDKPESYSEVRTINGNPYLTVLRKGEVVEESCLLCHGNPGDAPEGLVRLYGPERSFHRKIGDVISVISRRIPLSAAYSGGYRTTVQLSILLAVVLALLLGVQFFLYRRLLIFPLGVIHDKALAIAGSKEQLGEKIPAPAGWEFKELADAFNEMSQKLRLSMDQLEDRVAERTMELNASNVELKREITERRRAEEGLSESEERFKNLYQESPIPTFTWQKKEDDFILIDFNRAARQITNGKAVDYFGNSALELYRNRPQILGDMNLCYKEKSVVRREIISWHFAPGRFLSVHYGFIPPDLIIVHTEDQTERKQAEEKIKASLLEKETMLKEIHHRVKNNLQVVSSLLGLQSSYLQDEKTREIFQESQDRVRIMANIHTMLYQSEDLARVDFGGFIRDLVGRLQQSYGIAGSPIEVHIDIADVSLTIETSIPCGLILNELASNALKHAFPEGRGGKVNIRMATAADQFMLKVQDNGIGFPVAVDFLNPRSLGLELVRLLVEQINGAIDLQVEGGTTFTITFPKASKGG